MAELFRTRLRRLTPIATAVAALSQEEKEAYEKAMDEVEEKLQELELKKKEVDAMQSTLAEKGAELAKKTCEMQTKEKEFEIRYAELEKEKKDLADRLEDIDKKNASTCYTTDDISSFLNKTINDFNANTDSDSDVAKYVINSMDVDLKVRVLEDCDGDGKTTFKFLAPRISETSEESLSSIKISIQAVPK
ncbi:hypothetical protein [Fibrobacter sp. UWH4]|uniref:coiled-coil domain-containing protein n=1 Tax=Fibrobacter sp. UWH4 TaxID=1896210 RepID=UPI00091AEAC4|nr:hypothetical protein [Fibrobacter sp. UWH4]SHK67588.1 hypothetical protein SAMN05720762_102485 [Fibrobacter sp. UWH4]